MTTTTTKKGHIVQVNDAAAQGALAAHEREGGQPAHSAVGPCARIQHHNVRPCHLC